MSFSGVWDNPVHRVLVNWDPPISQVIDLLGPFQKGNTPIIYIYLRGISVQTVHDPKMSKISKFRGWPWDGYSVVEDA